MKNIQWDLGKNRKLKEERELLESLEKGEWVSVSDKENKIKRYAQYAKEAVKKNKRISIRISSQDYIGIQAKAIAEGLPYQTLITSIVHKYILGTLTPKNESSVSEFNQVKS